MTIEHLLVEKVGDERVLILRGDLQFRCGHAGIGDFAGGGVEGTEEIEYGW